MKKIKKKKKKKIRSKRKNRQQQNPSSSEITSVTTANPIEPDELKDESESENSTYKCLYNPQGGCRSFEPSTINGRNSPCEYWQNNKCSIGALGKNSIFV